ARARTECDVVAVVGPHPVEVADHHEREALRPLDVPLAGVLAGDPEGARRPGREVGDGDAQHQDAPRAGVRADLDRDRLLADRETADRLLRADPGPDLEDASPEARV